MSDQLFDMGDDVPLAATPVPPSAAPLAVRMRPRTLDELVGQEHLLGTPEKPTTLRRAIAEGRPHSMVLHGPPGSGKTTLARIVAGSARAAFEELSAVQAGRAEVRGVIDRASHRRQARGEPTVFFLDEIHASTRPSRTRCCRPSRRASSRSSERRRRTRTSRSMRRC
ncbi:MAG TPA: AAA family ATPase [Solirubrobacteraceae bacterium]|nr:AAA family ATPase [Solirubrobacteraceae bacterium]